MPFERVVKSAHLVSSENIRSKNKSVHTQLIIVCSSWLLLQPLNEKHFTHFCKAQQHLHKCLAKFRYGIKGEKSTKNY
jgi:hypothetical protein